VKDVGAVCAAPPFKNGLRAVGIDVSQRRDERRNAWVSGEERGGEVEVVAELGLTKTFGVDAQELFGRRPSGDTPPRAE
jgi:hypothetical protein